MYTEMPNEYPRPRPESAWRRWVFLVGAVLMATLLVLNIVLLAIVSKQQRTSPAAEPAPATSVFCSHACGRVCIGKPAGQCIQPCVNNCLNPPARTNGALSRHLKLDAIQHVGVTVSDLQKSVDFYVNVLGGVEVRDAGGDGWFGDQVMQLLMQRELLEGGANAAGAADLRDGGTDRLAARYINFGSLQVELLDYRGRNDSVHTTLPHSNPSSAPSIVNNMHIAWILQDDVDLNTFVNDLEAEAARRGFDKIKCNRIQAVSNEQQRKDLGHQHPELNSFRVTAGPFLGWQLAYCKGPDGEQFEFTKALEKAKVAFDQAQGVYVTGQQNPVW